MFGFLRRKRFDPKNAPLTSGEKQAAQTRCPPGWVYVKNLDDKGKVLAEEWQYKAPPDVFPADGLSYLPVYIARLLASTNWFTSLGANTPDGDHSISLWKNEGRIEIHEFFSPETSKSIQQQARSICDKAGFPVVEEYRTEDATQVVAWQLPEDPSLIFKTLITFATTIHGIQPHEPLEISLEEHVDERDRFGNAQGITVIFTYPIADQSAPPPI